jgi:hypothetical protein
MVTPSGVAAVKVFEPLDPELESTAPATLDGASWVLLALVAGMLLPMLLGWA